MTTSTTDRSAIGENPGAAARMDRLADLLIRISLIVGGIAALAMVLNVAVDVTLRSLFNQPIQATNPLVSYWWMLPLIFFGLAAAQRYGEHTDLPVIHARLSDRGQAIISIVALAATGLFVVQIGVFGLLNALEQVAVGEYDASTGVTIWPPRFAVPIACLAFVLVLVAQMLRASESFFQKPTQGPTMNTADDEGEVL